MFCVFGYVDTRTHGAPCATIQSSKRRKPKSVYESIWNAEGAREINICTIYRTGGPRRSPRTTQQLGREKFAPNAKHTYLHELFLTYLGMYIRLTRVRDANNNGMHNLIDLLLCTFTNLSIDSARGRKGRRHQIPTPTSNPCQILSFTEPSLQTW